MGEYLEDRKNEPGLVRRVAEETLDPESYSSESVIENEVVGMPVDGEAPEELVNEIAASEL